MKPTQIEKFVEDVLTATRERRLAWTATVNGAFAADVLHGGAIFRSFATNYERGGSTYSIGYIERKLTNEDDNGWREERGKPELLVFKDERLILSVTEYHVDDLAVLGSLIRDQNEDARSLLSTF